MLLAVEQDGVAAVQDPLWGPLHHQQGLSHVGVRVNGQLVLAGGVEGYFDDSGVPLSHLLQGLTTQLDALRVPTRRLASHSRLQDRQVFLAGLKHGSITKPRDSGQGEPGR